ncbi:MAG: hypothetical protein O2894_00920 [Planctomycetota bacterium]|nr:hypothetical protein [Planctomycetota bacterium]
MRQTVSSGDLALAAQPATKEAFRPYGHVLAPGARAWLGRRGRVLVTHAERRTGSRVVSELVRYPEARRAVLSVGRTPMWILVVPAGEQPDTPPAVFLVPGGSGVVLREGVWHAGPVPLADTTLCEMLEAVGPADRLDRRSVREFTGHDAVWVLLPEDPVVGGGALDLGAPGAVLLDAALQGCIRLGCLVLHDLEPAQGLAADADAAFEAAWQSTCADLRAACEDGEALDVLPGVAAGRALYRDLGLVGGRFVPRAETMLLEALTGPSPTGSALARALALAQLKTAVPLGAYDGGVLGEQVLLRTGGGGEEFEGADGRRVAIEGLPVLCDTSGPFGSPLGDAPRAGAGPRARRLLVVLYLPTSAETATVERWLDETAQILALHTGGREVGRLIVG